MKASVLAVLLVAAGCDRLARFELEPGESYCGAITLGGAYRQGLSPRVQMRLSWNGAAAEAGGSAGTLTTFDAGIGEQGERLIDAAPLRAIAPLSHDPLGELEFGDGRERNYLYAVSARDPSAEALVAFVSLRSDDRVEVRLLRAGTPDSDHQAGREPIFGLFVLSRQKGDCF
jgi:hypothetical protein